MEDAFRELDALGKSSLDKKDGLKSTVKLDDDARAALKSDAEANTKSLEKEAQLFTSMLEDSDQDAYGDVMKDLGGTAKEMPASVVDSDSDSGRQIIDIVENTDDVNAPKSPLPKSEEDPEQFMNQAIQEALDEARTMSPSDSAGKKMSDSILDDEEIMKEIEEIFEKGNEKLLASLDEIRQEQNALAKESAERRTKVAMDNAAESDGETKQRLASAEKSMEKQLSRVDKERAEVEKAVADLKKVQQDLEADPLMKMTSSVLKPAALAGVLLFSVRSVLDFVAMTGGGIDSEAHMTAALIQAGVALVCGIFLLFF